MAEWGAFHLTQKGASLIADAHNAKQLYLSRIALGAGTLADGQSVATLTALVDERQSFNIQEITNNGDGTFTIATRVNNNSLAKGYSMKELGVFVTTYSYDEDGNTVTTDVLFGTAQATEADFMPAPTAATMVDAPLTLTIAIASDATVTCKIDYDAYATVKYSDAQDESWYEKARALIQKAINGLDLLPVGTILAYSGDLESIPTGWHICDGTDGTPNLVGRFLEGVTTGAGTLKAAGLPNIKGTFDGNCNDGQSGKTGAFYFTGTAFGGADGQGGYYSGLVGFDASKSNNIYGNSSTVQPASYTVYYIIKQKNVTIEI